MPATKKAPARPTNPDTIPVDPGIETWRNIGESMVHITRIGEYGKQETELVYGGRSFSITPQERRLNQNKCFNPERDDPFTNGTFSPVTLLDDEPDTPKLRANPNVLDDAGVEAIFQLTGDAFSQRLLEITNLTAVDRLIAAAKNPDVGASVQQLETVKKYRKLLAGEPEEPKSESTPDGLPRAVTPR
jgi:hypothetical protein